MNDPYYFKNFDRVANYKLHNNAGVTVGFHIRLMKCMFSCIHNQIFIYTH